MKLQVTLYSGVLKIAYTVCVINSGYEAYFTILIVYLVYYLYYYVRFSIIYVLSDPDRLARSTYIHLYK